MALVVGDESAFEFDIRDGQMAFQFLVNGTCEKEISMSRDLRSSVNDFDAYLERHPGCRDLTLSSISVGKGSKFKGTFYKGATEKGATLGSPITATFNHGTARKAAARMVAGLSLGNPEDVLEYRGISFHYDRGASGKMEDTVIARMTVFSEIESSD
ncbi:MAG: hypothetical protein SGJ16_06260 [Nitrospirota bacterium]|nr:hypothetical protein [Nitrospirota bacterium]